MDALVTTRTFSPFHVHDRSFFVAFLAVCWLGVAFGFYPASSARFAGHADYPAPPILVGHAILFSGWLALLTGQIFFVRTKRLRLHKKLGRVGFLLVPLMVYSAVAAELHSQRFYIHRHDDDLHFFILPLFYAAAFGVLSTWALLVARRDPVSHKRLLLLATTVIVGAAYARWWGNQLTTLFGDGFWGMLVNTFAGTNLLLLPAVGYDFATRRRVHRTYLIVVPALLSSELLCSYVYHADWWMPIARQLIGIHIPLSA
jgi:FtsH-binding integral membrane protein